MSESEIKEAAERYANYSYASLPDNGEFESNYEYARGIAINCFIAGCEYADKEAYNRGWNESIEKAIEVANGDSELHWPRPQLIIEELQKLRK
jgi:hypothetical protein